MALAASTSAQRVEQLIMLTERLTGLIAEQLRAFEARRPHDAAANAEETARLANLYRHESLKLKADPKSLDDALGGGGGGEGHQRRPCILSISASTRLDRPMPLPEAIFLPIACIIPLLKASAPWPPPRSTFS